MSSRPHTAAGPDLTLSGPLLHPLRNARGHRIECLSGRALITAYDMHADIELVCGQVFLVPNDGLVLIEGADRCRLRIRTAPVQPGRPAGTPAIVALRAVRVARAALRDAVRLLGRLPSGGRS
ncbi:MAG: hypothetical protein ACTHL1_00365 [Burkholderiaceae bacterium]